MMKIKLDENIGVRGEKMLRDGGCDVETVVSEGLCGSSDQSLIAACKAEGHTLISLDKDFAGILQFPPGRYAGIVVLRLAEPLVLTVIEDALQRFLVAARDRDLAGKLWIIDSQRIREFDEQDRL